VRLAHPKRLTRIRLAARRSRAGAVTAPLGPAPARWEAMAAGRADGWAQRWSNRAPTWRHTSQGGFDRRRYEVVEAPARTYIQANHYLSGRPLIYIC
jgi:hypothetical protein